MPSKSFAFERGGPERLTISWKGAWRELAVACDGANVLTVPNQKSLRSGTSTTLPDGSLLAIKLAQRFPAPELIITRNGSPLSGSSTDPETQLKAAVLVLLFITGTSIVVGLAVELFDVQWLKLLGFGLWSVVFGCVFGILSYFVKQRSRIALAVAIAIFAIDGVAGVIAVSSAYGNPPIGGILVRVVLLIALVRGYSAIGMLKADRNKGV